MKRKRLDRDAWEFKESAYYQMRLDTEEFQGLVCYIKLIDEPYREWVFPRTVAIVGSGMSWLQLIPDGKKHVITAVYTPEDAISVWYVDIVEDIEYDPDGVAVFIDKYIDVVFTPQGDMEVDDRDELDEALASGDISRAQYASALEECDAVIAELCADIARIAKTKKIYDKILTHVNDRISSGEKEFKDRDIIGVCGS